MNTTELSLGQCILACDSCAEECDRVLAADAQYTGKGRKFSPEQIALVTCADVCRITAAALREEREHFRDLCFWCADVCDTLCEIPPPSHDWSTVFDHCRRCADECRSVA